MNMNMDMDTYIHIQILLDTNSENWNTRLVPSTAVSLLDSNGGIQMPKARATVAMEYTNMQRQRNKATL